MLGNFAVGPLLMRRAQKTNSIISNIPSTERHIFPSTFWLKWMGTTFVAIVFSFLLYDYVRSSSVSESPIFVILFAFVSGLSSLVQWYVFRNRLQIWWVAANTVAGIILGGLHYYLYNNSSWGTEHTGILLILWIIGNFAFGRSVIEETEEKFGNFLSSPSAKPVPKLIETGTRENFFLILLSVSLVLSTLYTLVYLLDVYELQKPLLALYGLASISTGITFILKKEIPRNFGFVTLAIFLFLDGIITVLYAFNSDAPPHLLTALTGIIPLFSGIYFIFQRQILKNVGFLSLCGYLISIGLAYFFIIQDEFWFKTFLVVAGIFALLAVISFFRRK
jgi:drug/metabolite transporter (DMT)-like permease